MASVRVMLLLWSLALLSASAQHQDERSVTQKTKEPKTAVKQQELEEGSGREIEENAEELLQDLYIHSTNPVLVSYLGHLATPRDLSQLDAIIRRQRQIRFKSSYQELPVVLRQPVGAKDLTGLSYFIRVDVDEDPPPSTALTLLPEGARTYFPPQVTTPHRKIKSRLQKDKKEKDEDSPLLLQGLTSQKTFKGPQRDGPSKPVAVGGYQDNSDHVTSKTSSTSTASRLVASPPSSSFLSPANPTISQAKDPLFLAKGLTVSSRYTTFPQSSQQPSHDKSLTSSHSSSQHSPASENLIIHNLQPSDSSASFLPSPSGLHSFSSNVSGASDPFHSSIVTSQPIFIFESPGSSSSQSSSDSFAPASATTSPEKALNRPSQYLELPNMFPLHPGISLPTQSLESAHSVSQSFVTPSSPSLDIQSLSQHLEQPSISSHSSRPPQITKSTAISSDQKTPLPPNSLQLSKAIQVFSHPSSKSTRPFHELSSIIDTQRAPVLFNSPASSVSVKVSQELEPPSHPFPQSGQSSNHLPVPSPLSSNPSRQSKSFQRPFSSPLPQPPPLRPSRPKGTPSSSSSASSITTASLGAKVSSSPASPTPTQKLSQESISASKLQANTNTFSKHRSRQNQTPLTSSKVSDPRPNAKAKSISSKPVNSIQQSEALRRGRSEGHGQGGSRNRERDRGSGDGEGRQIQSGINSATPADGKTRTVLNSDDPYVNSIPGRSGIDYPTFQTLPKTGFDCSSKQSGGYYADPEADCQVFHVCWGRRRASFLCPIGTIFNQQVLVCDWWYNVDCAATPEHEGVNAGIWEPRVTRNRL
ncbi:mucin-12-like [Penaeus monodon]|uniref:mucin-12-like n=1 Tax=Penaeus monodon TaxID=6687 RepID=UPI0018A78099|nr:mucin-12-like [Penaeus monodon]